MSVVICVLIGDVGAYLMGDKRQSEKLQNGSFVPVSENIRKIFPISQHVSIGITGNYVIGMHLLELLRTKDDLIYPREYGEFIETWCKGDILSVTKDFQVVVTGRDKYGKYVACTVQGRNNYNIVRYIPEKKYDIKYLVLTGGDYSTKHFEVEIGSVQYNLVKYGIQPDSGILEAMRHHIEAVAQMDNTVNTMVDSLVHKGSSRQEIWYQP